VNPANTRKRLATLFALLTLTLFLSPGPSQATEPDVSAAIRRLQDEWAVIFYTLPENQHAARFKELLTRVHAVSEKNPSHADPLILEGIVLCTYAGAEIGLGALTKVERARTLFEKAIAIDPKAMEASAYIALGNLYHRLPGWPISYGDDDIAKPYFEAALKLYPDNIDSNYFYGDFLLSQDDYDKALPYLEKADRAPIRPGTQISDLKLKEEIAKALADARSKNGNRVDFFTQIMPFFGSEKP
jgi:tetratricopeptide (TPR) repeat protein